MWHPKSQFPEYLKSALPSEKAEYFSKKFTLNHPALADCNGQLQKALFKADQYQILNVVGPTGVGKTELARNLTTYAFDAAGKNKVTRGLPAVYTEIPVLGNTSFDWKGLYARILENMSHPSLDLGRSIKVPEFPEHGRGYSDRYLTEGQIRKLLEQRIKDSGLKVLIFDEMQHLFKFSARNAEKSMDILKSLANITGCQIALIGTYESLNAISWSGQLARRTVNIHFHRYDWRDSQGNEDFLSSFMGLLAHVPYEFEESVFTSNTAEKIYMRSCGCVGVLKQIIERTITGKPEGYLVSLNDLLANSPSNNELIQMAREIQEGEAFFVEEPSDELRDLLGMTSEDVKDKCSKSKSPKKISGTKLSSKPGVRKPSRDKVT